MRKPDLDRTTRRTFLAATGAGGASVAGGLAPGLNAAQVKTSVKASPAAAREPDIETALQWWIELPNKWTPVGWKDHLFRFNVLFNGSIIAQPDLSRRTERWKGEGVQLSFAPSGGATFGRYATQDDGGVIQGWNPTPTPVLRSEWVADGLMLRQEVFAHVPGGKEIQTGIEPLFAWVRLSVYGSVEGLPLPDRYGFAIKINTPHISRTMSIRNNLIYHADRSAYPRTLAPDTDRYSPDAGYRLVEPDGRVRLGVPASQQCTTQFQTGRPTDKDSLLYIQFDARKGAHVDLLVPLLPSDKAAFDQELAAGYDRALQEANGYWSKQPGTAARIDTPEEYVNRAIRESLRFVEVVAERDPETGFYSLLTGSWTYSNVWTTPLAMTCIMLLDNLGHHRAVEKYLALLKQTQGSIVPPGDAFKPHPGYLATPKSLTSIDWLSDHGALLWAISEHALVSGNQEFAREYIPVAVKACDFIKDARRIEGHGGAPGILPAGVATDRKTKIQAVWNDGWNYKGLTTAARLLEQAGHPRAGEFAEEARAYKAAFTKAIREKTAGMPVWPDARGRKHRLVPTALSGDAGDELRHAFYLDTGPLFLVFSGLLDVEDELMRSTRLWFREGPPVKVYRYDSNLGQLPSLRHEMSSCEPCYSWNVFHSHQAADRARFLEGMYSILAGSLSRQTFTMCETRGGITGLTPCSLAIYMVRLAFVDDQAEPGTLHLLRIAPLAWLRPERECKFENVPTEFGPVSVAARLGPQRDELQLSYTSQFRHAPKRVVLHVPPVRGLTKITLNGKPLTWDGKQATLLL